MKKFIQLLLVLSTCIRVDLFAQNEKGTRNRQETYPYWPSYQYLEIQNLDTVLAQEWIPEDHIISGWDWSLPHYIEPSPTSIVGLQRKFGLDLDFSPMDLKFKANAAAVLWVKWRDLEPRLGEYRLQPLINRIMQANQAGLEVVLRIKGHSKLRGYDSLALQRGDAPLWLEDLGVNFLPRRDSVQYPRDNLNFDPSHPIFHKHYLLLVEELAKQGIPEMVKAAYVGYASPTHGDEGIGPYEERHKKANDTIQHVRERLDAWAAAFEGMEHKVYMGGSSDYGFEKGFGVRRGFVEMYMYRIPDADLGQYVDQEGYLCVDEQAPILEFNCFNGEENEEYEPAWATEERENRFGKSTISFPYRYFTSSLRTLQMRCTYLLTTGHLLPNMVPYLSLELGRTVEDTPDVWTFLRTSYLRSQFYEDRDYRDRPISSVEKNEGIETKNFERWLYQRDAPGYETQPALKINQPVQMWMIKKGRYYDYIAREGKKLGFNIDDRWLKGKDSIAVKITYFDHHEGELKLRYNSGTQRRKVSLIGDKELKTATFFVNKMEANSMDHGFDFTIEAGENTQKVIISMARVVKNRR